MMNFFWPSRKHHPHVSCCWKSSALLPGVSFAIRCPSLNERLRLTERIQQLCLRHDFLKAGPSDDQLQAAHSELLIRKLYLEWGLLDVKGLSIDGLRATPKRVFENGPEALSDEIIEAIKSEFGLTEDERKNS